MFLNTKEVSCFHQRRSPILLGSGGANPFDDDEEDEWDISRDNGILVDNGEPGVAVRALYDYEGKRSTRALSLSVSRSSWLIIVAINMGVYGAPSTPSMEGAGISHKIK